MEFLLFYMFASITIVSALFVILSKNAVQSVLYLVLTFCNGAAILLLLEVDFLALLLLVVYVGAIAVLFLFVIMMLSPKISSTKLNIPTFNTPFLGLGFFVCFVFALLFSQLKKIEFFNLGPYLRPEEVPVYFNWLKLFDGVGLSNSNLESLGQVLYTYYFYYFLVAGFILLVAMIGAIVLTLQPRDLRLEMEEGGSKTQPDTKQKRQQVFEQLARDTKNAVFLVK